MVTTIGPQMANLPQKSRINFSEGIVAPQGHPISRTVANKTAMFYACVCSSHEFKDVSGEKVCPYAKDPMAVFVAIQLDGQKVIHHPHSDKDENLRVEDAERRELSHALPNRSDHVRAFRLASDWRVAGRWTAFQHNAL